MKKIIDEIYKNFGNHKDFESFKKVVLFLQKNKAFFPADKNFKKSLKKRLNNYIDLKTNKRSIYTYFSIPVFAFLFLIFTFMYYFDSVLFFHKDGKIENIQKEQEIEMIGDSRSKMRSFDWLNDQVETSSFMMDESMENPDIEKNDIQIFENKMMMISSDSYVDDLEEKSFYDYCDENKWLYIEENDMVYCEIEEKICKESDYENSVCEFK